MPTKKTEPVSGDSTRVDRSDIEAGAGDLVDAVKRVLGELLSSGHLDVSEDGPAADSGTDDETDVPASPRRQEASMAAAVREELDRIRTREERDQLRSEKAEADRLKSLPTELPPVRERRVTRALWGPQK